MNIDDINDYPEGCIRTYTGKCFNVFAPTADMICIEDIAHSLSMQCRFGGHLPYFYSVAEHSLACAYAVPNEFKLAALLHDASEAYLLDIPRPVKKKLAGYKEIEDNLMIAIAAKFGFQYPLAEEVIKIDDFMLKLEWDNKLCWSIGFEVDKVIIKNRFINQFNSYVQS